MLNCKKHYKITTPIAFTYRSISDTYKSNPSSLEERYDVTGYTVSSEKTVSVKTLAHITTTAPSAYGTDVKERAGIDTIFITRFFNDPVPMKSWRIEHRDRIFKIVSIENENEEDKILIFHCTLFGKKTREMNF